MKRIISASLGVFSMGVGIGLTIRQHFLALIEAMMPESMTFEQIIGFYNIKNYCYLFSVLFGVFILMAFLLFVLFWELRKIIRF